MAESLTDEGGKETGVPGKSPWRRASEAPTVEMLIAVVTVIVVAILAVVVEVVVAVAAAVAVLLLLLRSPAISLGFTIFG